MIFDLFHDLQRVLNLINFMPFLLKELRSNTGPVHVQYYVFAFCNMLNFQNPYS